MFRRRSYVCSLALVVCLAASCSTQTTSESADTVLEPITELMAVEAYRELVVKLFQAKLNRDMSESRINLDEMSDILRRNEVFGKVMSVDSELAEEYEFVERKICEDFAIADFFASTTIGEQRVHEVEQDLGSDPAKYPDVKYFFTLTSFTDIDTRNVKNNIGRLSDIFSLSSDKRCTGTSKGLKGFFDSTNFTTGNFPEVPANGFETYNYVQLGEGPDQFARSVSLMILEPAKTAVSIVVTAFNLRYGEGSKVTSDDMLFEVSDITKDLKALWKNKIQTDPDWLALNN